MSHGSIIEDPKSSSLGSLRIPESRTGFFGYLEEKSQQHVSVDSIMTDEWQPTLTRLTRNFGPKECPQMGHPMSIISDPRLYMALPQVILS